MYKPTLRFKMIFGAIILFFVIAILFNSIFEYKKPWYVGLLWFALAYVSAALIILWIYKWYKGNIKRSSDFLLGKSIWTIVFYFVDYVLIIIYSKNITLTYVSVVLGILGLAGGIFLYRNSKNPIDNEPFFALSVIFAALGFFNMIYMNIKMLIP